MPCRSGCVCNRKPLGVQSSRPSTCSKSVSTLRKDSSTKPSSSPLYYRGGGSGYSKPSAPQSKIVSRNKPPIKTKKVLLSKPGSVIGPSRSDGSSHTKPPAAPSRTSSSSKSSEKPKTSSVTTSCCGSEFCNPTSATPSKTSPYSTHAEKVKDPSKKPSSIASASDSTKHYIESENTTTSPPSTKPKNLTKSSVVVKIIVRTPHTTIEQETAFDIDSK